MFPLQHLYILMSSWWKMQKTVWKQGKFNFSSFLVVLCIFLYEDIKIWKYYNGNMVIVFEGLSKSVIIVQKFQVWFLAPPIGLWDFQGKFRLLRIIFRGPKPFFLVLLSKKQHNQLVHTKKYYRMSYRYTLLYISCLKWLEYYLQTP